jgi:hypothetical protein
LSDDDDPILSDEENETPLGAPDDAASTKGLKRKRKRKADVEREAVAFWKSVFATRAGRREMYALLADSGLFATPFAVGPNGFPQPEATWYKAGQHAFGQRLFFQWTRIDRARVFLMLDEHDPYFAKNVPPPVEES